MCGIAGILNIANRNEIQQATTKSMLSIMTHRGPDEFGIFRDNTISIGHARLSIIDLSGGHQPMTNEDESLWITFNGEIFNYIELRKDLTDKGHIFATQSDTEVIIHLYEEYGTDCLKYLNGQFAFAIWDRKSKELFLARDRMGIRPLFFTRQNNRFYFASEIKSILATREIDTEIDTAALNQIFTFWYTTPPKSAFKNISELAPGTFLLIKDGVITHKQYWELDFSEKSQDLNFEDASDQLRDLLIDSTRLRLRADVPVGAYLSGGLDSSVTTALIKNFTNSPLETFSVAFDDKRFDESDYQMEMSKALGTKHHQIRCSYKDIGENFPDVIWHAEKPVLRTAPTPLYLLSKLVQDNNFKVVMTGEGADEILGGYDIFKEVKIRQFCAKNPQSSFRPALLRKLYPYLPAFQSQSHAYMNAFFNDRLSDTNDNYFSHRPRWKTTSKIKSFYSRKLKEQLNGNIPENSLDSICPPDFKSWQAFEKAQYLETKGLLPGYLLSSQGDRVLMAHSIEGRFPFLDHRIVEFAAKLPYTYKMKVLNEKFILKECIKSYLPKTIVKRTKQPYMAPDNNSFFSNGKGLDYVEELLSENSINNYGYFNPKAMALLIKKCKRGGVVGFKDNMSLIGVLSTQLLHHQFVENFPRSSTKLDNLSIVDYSGSSDKLNRRRIDRA